MSENKFGSWTVAESPVSIEYSLVVIEEIRHEVAEGFQRLSRGGIEVGGILYGSRDGRTVRVLAMRPIACEHARGPAFLLSDKDRVALNEQLVRDQEDSQLEGLISVGWFLSHTRSEISLTESDLEIYSIFFPAPWQVTLVIRPGRGGSMRAGYFVREADGTVKSEQSYLEFNFPDRLAGVLDRSPDRPRERPSRKIPTFYRADTESAAAATAVAPVMRGPLSITQAGPSGPQLMLPAPAKKKWPWLVAWAVVVLALLGGAYKFWFMPSGPEPISLSMTEHDGEMQVHWGNTGKLVRNAVRGSLHIEDGGDSKTESLSKEKLASGNFTFVRKSGDVEVRLTIENSDGSRWQEASRYLGRAPAAVAGAPVTGAAVPTDSGAANGDLQREVERLRDDNTRKDETIKRLERQLKILQSHGVDIEKQ